MAGQEFEVTGGARLDELSKKLRAAGDRDITNALRRQIRASTQDTRRAVKQSAIATLPARGGLNRFMAATPTASTTLGKTHSSVRIVMRKRGHDVEAFDKGEFRHPIFGRKTWTPQSIEPGFFSDVVERDAAKTRRAVADAVAHAAEQAANL